MSTSDQFTPSQQSGGTSKAIPAVVIAIIAVCLVLVCIPVVVIAILLLVGPQISNIFSKVTNGLDATYIFTVLPIGLIVGQVFHRKG